MDKQKDFEKGWEEYKEKSKQEIEEMIGIIQTAVGGCAKYWAELIAINLINAGYRKIPENAVVLSREEYEKLQALKDDYIKGYEAGVDEGWDNARKETAEKFAERVKMAFYYEFDELIPSIMADKIDEICKEITEGKV